MNKLSTLSLLRWFWLTSIFFLVSSVGFAQPTWRWALQRGDTLENDYAGKMVVTPSGKLVTFANHQSPNRQAFYDIHPVLTAFDSSGAILWEREYLHGVNDLSSSVIDLKLAPGSAGGFYGLLAFAGTIDLGPGRQFTSSSLPNPETRDALVIRFDSVGQVVWARQIFGRTNVSSYCNVEPKSLAVDIAGDVWVGGMSCTSFTIGPFQYNPDGSRVGFLAKYRANGTELGGFPFGGRGYSDVLSLAPDPRGGVLVAGVNGSNTPGIVVVLGNITLPIAGESNFFVARFTGQLQPQWARMNGNTDSTVANFITMTPDRGYLVTGHMKGTTQFGSQTFTSAPGRRNTDLFVAKYDSSGQAQWGQRIASPLGEELHATDVDAQGNVYLAARTQAAPVTAGNITVTPPVGSWFNGIFAKVSASGQAEWLLQTSGAQHDWSTAIAVDAGRTVYCSGYFTTAVTLGPTTMTAVGGGDYFIARLDGARPTGLFDDAAASGAGLTLFPNPTAASPVTTLRLAEPLTTTAAVSLLDALGRTVRRGELAAGAQEYRFDVAGLPTGIYVVGVRTNTARFSKRLVVAP